MLNKTDKIINIQIVERWYDILLKWVGVIAIIISIFALGFSIYTFNYSKYADIQLSNIPEDVMDRYQLKSIFNNLGDRELELSVRNTGGMDSGEISLASLSKDIFEQSDSTMVENIKSGENNHAVLKFNFNYKLLEEIQSGQNLFYIPIRVRCDNCKTEIKYVPICIWQEDYSECKDKYPLVS